MMIYFGILVVCGLAFSVYLIAEYDPGKLPDHIARSLVQMGIAVVSIFLAITLFNKQAEDREVEIKRQQRQMVLAFLRSKIREAEMAYETRHTLLELGPVVCFGRGEDCLVEPKELDLAALFLTEEMHHISFDLEMPIPLDRSEVWQLMRSAPRIDENYFVQLIFGVASNEHAGDLMQYVRKEVERKRASVDSMSQKERAQLYVDLTKAQTLQLYGTIRTVCAMSRVLDQLANDRIDGPSFTLGDDKCPPYGDTYRGFMTALSDGADKYIKNHPEETLPALRRKSPNKPTK